jgi:hypothetical protein
MAKFYSMMGLEEQIANCIFDDYINIAPMKISEITELVKEWIEQYEKENRVRVNVE